MLYLRRDDEFVFKLRTLRSEKRYFSRKVWRFASVEEMTSPSGSIPATHLRLGHETGSEQRRQDDD